MKEIKVSIIVPVYNSVSFLPKCVESLLSQTLQEVEIILVNDASTDHSLEILQEYQAKHPEKIVVIDSKINQRQGGARNLGIEIAKGEYIGFVDSDDWIEKDMYAELYQEAIKHHSDICYGKGQHVDEKGKVMQSTLSYYLPTETVTENNRKEMLMHHITLIPCNIYKRSLIMEHNIRFPIHIRYEDIFFDPFVLLHAKHIAAVDKILYNYYIHSASTIHNTDEKKYKDKVAVALLLVEELKKHNCYDPFKDEFDYLYFRKGYIHATINYMINTRTIKKDTILDIRAKLLSVTPHYRSNPYYRQKASFVYIDKMISSNSAILWKLLQVVAKRFIKTI